jgi:hypothetical protein
MASLDRRREYHTSAVLLPDARVVHAGGNCHDCSKEANLEVFSPPYLFNPDGTSARRPTVNNAPDRIRYGVPFTVEFGNVGAISRMSLIKLGQSTHSTNFDQRYVPLSYTVSGRTLSVTAPANANIAPPGYYMLFLINGRGVPSLARIVKVGARPGLTSVEVDVTKFYNLVNLANGLCMTAGGIDNRSPLVQAACNGSASQRFAFKSTRQAITGWSTLSPAEHWISMGRMLIVRTVPACNCSIASPMNWINSGTSCKQDRTWCVC